MGEKGGSVHRMTEEDSSVLLGLQPSFFFPCIHAHVHYIECNRFKIRVPLIRSLTSQETSQSLFMVIIDINDKECFKIICKTLSGLAAAQSVGDWAELLRILGSSRSSNKTCKVFWYQGDMPRHL